MVGISSSLEGPLLIEGLILVLVLRRTYLLAHGTSYSAPRLAVTGIFYGFLFGVDLLEDAFLFPPEVLVADVGVLLAVTVVMEFYARQHVTFPRGAGGGRRYRFPMTLGLVYVALFALRTAITLLYAPQLIAFGVTTPGSLSGTALIAIGIVDGLFAGSTGLLFGRTIGVVRAARAFPEEPPARPRPREPLP